MKWIVVLSFAFLHCIPGFSSISIEQQNQKLIHKAQLELVNDIKRVLYSNRHIKLDSMTKNVLLDVLEKLENSVFKLSIKLNSKVLERYHTVHLKSISNAINKSLNSNSQILPGRVSQLSNKVFQDYSQKYFKIQ